tara:strand:+ start:4243 stop:4743 length:501 start_codon:yes stop_codon:yes gene_type:complete
VSKLFLIISFLFIFIFASCDQKTIYSFDEDIKELIEWSINLDNTNAINQGYKPVSSQTLSEIVSLELDSESVEHNKGIIIGILNFNYNKQILNNDHKDLLLLISKAQKFEEFNILIESNNIKTSKIKLIDEVFEIFLSNGIKNKNISLNYIDDSNKNIIITIIKLL